MSEENKPKEPKKKVQRADKVLILRMQSDIHHMLTELKTHSQICEHLRVTYSKSNTQARRYISQVLEVYGEEVKSDLEGIRSATQMHMLSKYHEMLREHRNTGNVKYIRLAIDFYDRYIKLYPNGLEPELKEAEGTLNITFHKIEE